MSYLESLYNYFYGERYDTRTLEVIARLYNKNLQVQIVEYNSIFRTKLWKMFNVDKLL